MFPSDQGFCLVKRVINCVLLLLLAISVAAALRLPRLGERPMHADEAVQAARFRQLWQQGRYVYDPNEFHGPTLMYATLPSATLSGAADFAGTTETTYRLVPVLFGIGLLVLLFLLVDTLGVTAVLVAALLVALSPAMVFYSRYYIHETLLVFFSLAAIGCGWRYVVSRKLVWSLLAGICVGLMQATKETAAISYLAAVLATVVVWLDVRRQPIEGGVEKPWPWQHLAAGGVSAVVVAAVLLSSFFTNLRGPIDGVLTYLPWLSRAGGDSPHIYPWSFYLHRLIWWRVGQGFIWSEGLIFVLAAIGLGRAVTASRGASADNNQITLVRWLACYTIALLGIYSLIPYKTPWCLLQFLVGLILLAGVGAALILQSLRPIALRAIIATLLVVGAGHLGWQAYRASFVVPADVGNPYVFAHTSPDLLQLAERLQGLAETSPQRWKIPVKVIWTDAYYWPLPWYLRRFENLQLWRAMPDDPVAPVVIAAPQYSGQLDGIFGRDYIMVQHELRPQVIMQLWVEYDLWEAYLRRIGQIEGE